MKIQGKMVGEVRNVKHEHVLYIYIYNLYIRYMTIIGFIKELYRV